MRMSRSFDSLAVYTLGAVTALAVALRCAADLALVVGELSADKWLPLPLGSVVLFVIWLFLTHAHLARAGVRAAETSHTALWCWLIPGFGCVQPYFLARDLFQPVAAADDLDDVEDLDEPPAVRSRLVAVWWFFVLVRIPIGILVAVFATSSSLGALLLFAVPHALAGALTLAVVIVATLRAGALADVVEARRPVVF